MQKNQLTKYNAIRLLHQTPKVLKSRLSPTGTNPWWRFFCLGRAFTSKSNGLECTNKEYSVFRLVGIRRLVKMISAVTIILSYVTGRTHLMFLQDSCDCFNIFFKKWMYFRHWVWWLFKPFVYKISCITHMFGPNENLFIHSSDF